MEADVTGLVRLRAREKDAFLRQEGVELTLLPYFTLAVCETLREFPMLNARWEGEELRHYSALDIGIAVASEHGLVVPVIRGADDKGIVAIAKEMADLAKLARDGKLKPDQMQGGCFTISSLGGIGGTYFTPIINAPEVAILGVCRSAWRQVSADGRQGLWRLMLPLSLSYDHRVIDGASAARFNSHFAGLLADMRRVFI